MSIFLCFQGVEQPSPATGRGVTTSPAQLSTRLEKNLPLGAHKAAFAEVTTLK
jgi:hypothetical protein